MLKPREYGAVKNDKEKLQDEHNWVIKTVVHKLPYFTVPRWFFFQLLFNYLNTTNIYILIWE